MCMETFFLRTSYALLAMSFLFYIASVSMIAPHIFADDVSQDAQLAIVLLLLSQLYMITGSGIFLYHAYIKHDVLPS